MMNTTIANSGEKRRLKRLLQHLVPIADWIGCDNHQVAPLNNEIKSVANVDVMLLALWKFFLY